MSAFDLAPDRAFENQINHARENPLDLSTPAGFFTGMGSGIATGVGRLMTDAQRITGLALGAAAGSFDMLTGDALKAQDKVFEHIVAPADKLARRLTPNPTEVGLAGQVLHSLVKIGGEAALLGPTGTGVVETLSGTLDAMDKGVDLQTAGKVGLTQGIGTAVGVAVPATLGKAVMGMRPGLELLTNAGFGASVNIAQGVAVRGFTSEIYEKAGRHDLAIQSVPLDREALAVDAILGAAFGAGFRTLEMKKEAKQAKAVDLYRNELAKMLKPSDIDAALVANDRLKMERPEMGLPADLQSRDAHVANLKGAIDDLIEGKPVTLRQPTGEFIPDAEGVAVRKSAEDALAEHRVVFDAERQAEAARLAEMSGHPAANNADAGSAVDGRSQADQSAARSAETRPGAGTQEAGLASDSPEISAAARYAEQRPDAVIPMDDDGVSSVADANAIIHDLKAAADETEVGIKAAITCFLRAA